ncbi:MAG: phytanoyl-CoA dioxygenase family protein, partial [Patescibacteria group bacterium]
MSVLFSLIKKPAKFAVRTYYKAVNSKPLWLTLNKEAISFQKKTPAMLGAIEKHIADNLKKDGISYIHLDELFPNQKKFGELLSYAKKIEENASVKTGKKFLEFYFDDHPVLDFKNPFVKMALEDKILGVINSYMGMFSKFYMFTLNKTMPVEENFKETQSQRWHRDPEDRKMVKVFIYFNDVDENSGPFIYVKGSHVEGRYGSLFPPEPPRGSLPPAEEIKKLIPQKDILVCTAPAGTIIFCDTRGIHKGGYATQKHRVMSTFYYSSRASQWPLRYQYPENFKEKLAALNPSHAQRYALDNFYRIG